VNWNELLRAFALVLVIEGLMPFAFPQQWRAALQQLAALDTRWLRLAGLGALVTGAALLQIA
jgi:uncharacterized protein